MQSVEDATTVSPPARKTLPWSLGYLVLMSACLVQWGKPSLWSRLDIFSGSYLVMRAFPVFRSLLGRRKARVSAECQRERWGSTSAPGWVNWAVVLTLANLAIFLDYGHWHLVAGLERRGAQAFGLVLYLAIALWQIWTDRYFNAAFAGHTVCPSLMQNGPFRYVRHPRYAGAMASKVATALVFASAAGWLLAALWWALLLRQIRLEETHLRELFGSEYETYARQTAKLIPRIY